MNVLHVLNVFAHSTIGRGAITGLVTAAGVDLHAFASWKSAQEAATYNWRVAGWRWFQGAVSGAVVAAGYGALIS